MEQKWRRLTDRLLVVLIVLLVGANLWLMGRNWFPSTHTSHTSQSSKLPEWFKQVMQAIQQEPYKRDPPLGTEIKAFKQFSGRRLVLVIDRCTECVARSLKVWAEVTKATGLPKMVLVTRDPLEEAKQALAKWKIKAEILSDPKGSIAEKLNAFFTPRVYAFQDGKLVWKQDRLNPPQGDILEVGQ